MTNSRAKGARGERELADALTMLGVSARRSVQYCGKGTDSGDLIVDGFPHHLECKRFGIDFLACTPTMWYCSSLRPICSVGVRDALS